MPLVPHADLDAETGAGGDAVLKEQRRGALVDDIPPLAERDAERVGGSFQKCRDAGEVEGPGAFGEIVVDEMTVLAAQPKCVAAARVAQRVREHIGGIVTPLRLVCGAAEVKA